MIETDKQSPHQSQQGEEQGENSPEEKLQPP